MYIREIQAHELCQLLDLYQHLHDADDPIPERQRLETVWREICENSRIRMFGVYFDDHLVSSCTITIIPNLTRGCCSYALIENVVTHSAHRGKGYGKAVLKKAQSYAWSQDCYKVMLLTGRKDESTLTFYESAGFARNDKQAFIAKSPR